MSAATRAIVRRFIGHQHIRNVLDGPWVDLVDETGAPLPGIKGRVGAVGPTTDGVGLGADLVEMQPGAAFPLHVHLGDHILYIISGEGLVHVDDADYPLREGDTVFIPAEYPHGVRVLDAATAPLVFLAVGHPHRHVGARDRMRLSPRGRSLPSSAASPTKMRR